MCKKFYISCLVPECETANDTKYSRDWVKDVLPGSISDSSQFIPDECLKYKFKANNSLLQNETCDAHWFDNEKVRCHEWVFDGTETAIINDVRKCVHFLWVFTMNINNHK